MKESTIEDKVVLYAKQLGWLVYKFVSPGNRGVADRIFIKAGHVFFIEFKTKTGKTATLQALFSRKMWGEQIRVWKVDNVEDGIDTVNLENDKL